MIGKVSDRRLITYGFSPQADIQATNLKAGSDGSHFDVKVQLRGQEERVIEDIFLPMHGEHNVQNSLAAIAVGLEMEISDEKVKEGLAAFSGVKRRFTKTGEVNGITVIDDYAHHPVEISAVLKAARSATKRNVLAVVQPHRYSRLKDLFEDFCACFNDADSVIVADVFEAGEQPIEGADKTHMVQGLKTRGHRDVVPMEGPDSLAGIIADKAEEGDLVVCLGAGSITQWAHALPDQLNERLNGK